MRFLYLLLLFFVSVMNLNAQVLLTDTFYTQNFNSLATSGDANPKSGLPLGWTFRETGFGSDDNYGTVLGGQLVGGAYSFGVGTDAERAFGTFVASGVKTIVGVDFVNTTGKKIVAVKITYIGEHWYAFGNDRGSDSLLFQYQVGRSFAANVNWISASQLNYITPSVTPSSFSLNGNEPANRKELSYVIQNIEIVNQDTLSLRWVDVDIASPFEDGMGIDDFSITLYTVDQFAPELLSTTPKTGTILTDTFTTASLMFSEHLKKGTGSVKVKRISTGEIVHSININDASITVNNKEMSFAVNALLRETDYEITIDSAAITDTIGNAFAGVKSQEWIIAAKSITDTQAPHVDTLLPGKNASISTNYINARIFFKEKIKKGTVGKISIRKTFDNALMQELSITDPLVVVQDNQIYFRSAFLPTGFTYAIIIDSGAIKDLANNVYPAVKKGDWNISVATIFGIPPDNHALTINTLLPNNNAVVAISPTKLEMYWYEYPIQQYGKVNIRNVETDTIVQSLDVRSTAVQTSQLYTVMNIAPLQVGNYYVEILPWNFINIPGTEYVGTTKTTWKFTVGTLTSVTDRNNNEIKLNIYGNPAANTIYAGLNKTMPGKAEVVLMNMAGVVVYRNVLTDQRNFQINTKAFAKGTYLLKINAGKYNLSEKVQVQ